MLATLDNDIILGWVSEGGIEVGPAPADVGMERLRYDGVFVVDLAELPLIHVERKKGVFILHAVPVPGSQPVDMTYSDRKKLIDEDGVYRVKSALESEEERKEKVNNQLKTVLREDLKESIGDPLDMVADLMKCLSLVLVYLEGGPDAPAAKTIIDTLAPLYCGIYENQDCEQKLAENAVALRERLAKYYLDRI